MTSAEAMEVKEVVIKILTQRKDERISIEVWLQP